MLTMCGTLPGENTGTWCDYCFAVEDTSIFCCDCYFVVYKTYNLAHIKSLIEKSKSIKKNFPLRFSCAIYFFSTSFDLVSYLSRTVFVQS